MKPTTRIEVNGVSLCVTDLPQWTGRKERARGLPIVMVHGLAASSAFWYGAGAPILSMMGRTVLYDLRGHGKSGMPASGYGVTDMARDLGALVDRLGFERFHLVAHSFGGMIALQYALRQPPGRIASLSLVDVRVRPLQQKIAIPTARVPKAVERQLAEIGIDIDRVNHGDDGVDYLRTVAKIEVNAGAEADNLLAALYRHPRLFRNRGSAERWIDLCEKVSLIADLQKEPDFKAGDLPKLSMPMQILVGGKSTTVPSAHEMARLCPQAVLQEIPGVGHFFPVSQPQLFLRPTMRFLNSLNPRRGGSAYDGTGQDNSASNVVAIRPSNHGAEPAVAKRAIH